jgi:hypothetical protein
MKPVRDLCGAPNADLDCYAKVRLEIKDGIDRTPIVNVNRPNSIENRLIKLLIHLQAQFPNDDWTQFLAGKQFTDSMVENRRRRTFAGRRKSGNYRKISSGFARHNVCGDGFQRRCRRASQLDCASRNNAERNHARPLFRLLAHARRQREFYCSDDKNLDGLRMNNYGAVVNVDNSAPPYNNTHSLTTDFNCANTHGCIVVDNATPIGTNGTAVFRPVWEYLLSGTTVPFAVNRCNSSETDES